MLIISRAKAPKGRMEPTEKLKSRSSGKASIMRRVNRRWPCQCSSRASGVMTTAAIMDLVATVAVRLAAFLACLATLGTERLLTNFFLSAPFLLVAREDADFFDADFLPPFFAGIVLFLLLDHQLTSPMLRASTLPYPCHKRSGPTALFPTSS